MKQQDNKIFLSKHLSKLLRRREFVGGFGKMISALFVSLYSRKVLAIIPFAFFKKKLTIKLSRKLQYYLDLMINMIQQVD